MPCSMNACPEYAWGAFHRDLAHVVAARASALRAEAWTPLEASRTMAASAGRPCPPRKWVSEMSSLQGGTEPGQGQAQPAPPTGLHDAASVQRLAADLERLAAAVARDEKRAQELVEAVHSRSGANVEKVFRDAGVESRVSIEERTAAAPTSQSGGAGDASADSTSTTHETHHTELHIHLGPIDIGVSIDKESETETVVHT